MTSHQELVARVGQQLDEVLTPLLPADARYALLDFPNHNNVGDNAIWLGERVWLKQHGREVVYTCDLSTYSRERCARQLSDGIILLHGGGNFGDLWALHHQFRRRVVEDFPGHRIVQLPQSVFYQEPGSFGRDARLFAGHGAFTALLRDSDSLAIMTEALGDNALLCPDSAFALGSFSRHREPTQDVVWLARTDFESDGQFEAGADEGVRVIDWFGATDDSPLRRLRRRASVRSRTLIQNVVKSSQLAAKALELPITASFDLLARRRFRLGRAQLELARVLITDRLHGHILATLLGIPHVLVPDRHGKVASFVRTFTSDSDLSVWVDAPEDPVRAAYQLLERGRSA
jgi:pyruvyl transferase EpsO